ncbi:EPS15 homology (EH) [Macleaya cordata]|uniref:EPS15 homology (EH) n=1 Tax=Macleaya cordata TaxID=56857 RepID=A0A200R8J3_MACCD|nr:EPS15 homology (EH) [Macleaya cordata]
MGGENQAAQIHRVVDDLFEEYFRRADLDQDGRISSVEQVIFFRGFDLPMQQLGQVWDGVRVKNEMELYGYLGREAFYDALKLVTVLQSGRELTLDVVVETLYGPDSAKIVNPAAQVISHDLLRKGCPRLV